MAERPNASVLKTDGLVRGPGVRIPPLPFFCWICLQKKERKRAKVFARVGFERICVVLRVSKTANPRPGATRKGRRGESLTNFILYLFTDKKNSRRDSKG